MSSEMREIKAMADAVEYGIALGKLDAPAVFTKMRDLLNRAILARTEAGAACPICGGRDCGCGDECEDRKAYGYEMPSATSKDSAPAADVAVAWTDDRGLERLREGKQELVSAVRLRSDTVALYTHPQDASGDAERYRFLRENHSEKWEDAETHTQFSCSIDFAGQGHDIDAAIDAAMQAKEAK